MGGAGDSPAPVGDPPTGTALSHVAKRPFSLPRIVVSVPSGGSPDGTGGSPVLPGNHFPNTLLLLCCLSTPFHKYDHVCCVDFRFWRGATREHPPQWGCDRGATKPEPKSDATLRAAFLFGPDVVAHSLQTPEGYARRSRLVWAENPSPQTWSDLWNGVLRPAGAGGSPSFRQEVSCSDRRN